MHAAAGRHPAPGTVSGRRSCAGRFSSSRDPEDRSGSPLLLEQRAHEVLQLLRPSTDMKSDTVSHHTVGALAAEYRSGTDQPPMTSTISTGGTLTERRDDNHGARACLACDRDHIYRGAISVVDSEPDGITMHGCSAHPRRARNSRRRNMRMAQGTVGAGY